jgi:hypothetical protein
MVFLSARRRRPDAVIGGPGQPLRRRSRCAAAGRDVLALRETRLVPNGLSFLDEPETPLSPTRVLALIVPLADRVRQGRQFLQKAPTLNEVKTSVKDARAERFDFLGYSFGPHCYQRNGKSY